MITDQSVIQLPGSYAVDHMALIDRKELQDATVFDSHEADAATDTVDLDLQIPLCGRQRG